MIQSIFEKLIPLYPSHPMHDTFGKNPWQMLVAVMLSQRATDLATIKVAKHLFSIAPTPQKTIELPISDLENILRPIGFFHQKSKALHQLAKAILEKHNGKVPLTEVELLALPQVGRKTANIILTMYTGTPQLAVDIHVHRIANRVGWVQTTQPEQTEKQLTPQLTKNQIKLANQLLVQHGQETCRPISPRCSTCSISRWCKKIGVTNSR